MKSWLGAKPFDSTYQFEERMQYRRLMGLGEVSVLGLGCTRLGSLTEPCSRPERLSLIAAAVNAGITLFDTADIYAQGESERILGEALRSIDACRWFVDSPWRGVDSNFPFRARDVDRLSGQADSLGDIGFGNWTPTPQPLLVPAKTDHRRRWRIRRVDLNRALCQYAIASALPLQCPSKLRQALEDRGHRHQGWRSAGDWRAAPRPCARSAR